MYGYEDLLTWRSGVEHGDILGPTIYKQTALIVYLRPPIVKFRCMNMRLGGMSQLRLFFN